MEKLENLELVMVVNDGKKATLTFLYEEKEEIREVVFNKQVYNNTTSKFEDNEEKAEKVEKWCQEYFNVSFDELETCVGVKKDVYQYDKYCSLWENEDETDKFDVDDIGLIDTAIIKLIKLDSVGIKIHIEYNDKVYQSKMTYSTWIEKLKKFMVNPTEKNKKLEKFKEKFGVDIENKDELIGKSVMFEVKKTGKFVWVELKPIKNMKK